MVSRSRSSLFQPNGCLHTHRGLLPGLAVYRALGASIECLGKAEDVGEWGREV